MRFGPIGIHNLVDFQRGANTQMFSINYDTKSMASATRYQLIQLTVSIPADSRFLSKASLARHTASEGDISRMG